MAQNITLLGASYSAVPAVTLPKTGGGTARFDDASITTATASDVASGKVFLASDGTITTGTASGGSAVIQPLSVTQNGTYTAPSGVDGYSPVTVNVSGGGGGSLSDQVRFFDYDGTLVDSYSALDFNALTAMPSNPSHTGLVAQGWNWSLADAKAYLAKYPDGVLNIGQNYTTDTGDTRVYIYIDPDTPANRMTFYFRFTSSVANNATVDWGDGTVETLGSTTANDYSHTYSKTGNLTIKLTVTSGTVSFVGTGTSATSGYSIFGNRANTNAYNRGRVRAVEIGDNVEIGQSCFFNCISLETVSLPSTITSIGTYAFDACYSLTSINIPDGVTSISNYAFYACYSLTSIAIPDGVTSINNYAFHGCSLPSITIPDGVTSIGAYVFQNCYSLPSITIPDGVTSIGANAFQNCYSLPSITIPDGVTSISASVFYGCSSLTSITIPDGVTIVDSNAFSSCYSITSITIPDSVTRIAGGAFGSCYCMSEYHFLPTTPPTLVNTNAFNNIPSDCVMYVPQGSLGAYQTATNWSTYASRMVEETA